MPREVRAVTELSEFGLAFIAHEEGGFVDHVYPDQIGAPTIGFGHLIVAGETFPPIITHAEGLALFRRDLARFVACVNRCITYPCTQRQFDMLVSLAFNAGEEGLEHSLFRKAMNAGDIGTATQTAAGAWTYTGAMREWSTFRRGKVNGILQVLPVLVGRRRREIAVFLEEHAHRDRPLEGAPDMRDRTLSEVRFGEPPDDEPPPAA